MESAIVRVGGEALVNAIAVASGRRSSRERVTAAFTPPVNLQ